MSQQKLINATSLHNNPFYLIGATTRDNRQKIIELAEEKSLFLDNEACTKARADLINPRTRLSVELAWLPGISPKQAVQLIQSLESNPESIKGANLPDLASANLFAAAIESLSPEIDLKIWVDWITEFTYGIDEIDAECVMRYINEDRVVSGFPEIKSLEVVEAELLERRKFYKETVKAAIDKLPTLNLVDVVTRVVDITTDSGEESAPILVSEIIDSYEIQAQGFLQKEADNILKLVQNSRQVAEQGEVAVNSILLKLDRVLRNWNRFAQPIQLSMKSRGLDHDMSRNLAIQIRSLGIDLCNEYGMVEVAKRITEILYEVFAELPEVVDKLKEDTSAIEDLLNQVNSSKKEQEEWAREISFNAELGLVFKDKLSISPEGIQYKNQIFPLDSITKVRWGSTRHSVNGIPTGTTHTIYFGNSKNTVRIETRNSRLYDEFIGKMWQAVCVNMLSAMLNDIKNGAKYRFGDSVVDDFGAEITRHKFLRSNERVYVKWDKLRSWCSDGNFYLGLDGDMKSTYSAMSFINDNNVHLLNAAVDIFFKKGGDRLSSIF